MGPRLKKTIPYGESVTLKLYCRVKEDITVNKANLITIMNINGVYNDIKRSKSGIKDHPALFIVDAIKFTGALISMTNGVLDVVVSDAKSLYDTTGLSFLAFNEKAFKVQQENPAPSFYWDVDKGLKSLEKGQTPYTPAVSLFQGLDEALQMMKEEGLENILQRHKDYRDMVRDAVRAMGLRLLARDDNASNRQLLQ